MLRTLELILSPSAYAYILHGREAKYPADIQLKTQELNKKQSAF
jgi:hypothetical protein